MKTKLVLKQFSGAFAIIGTLRFDGKSFMNTFLDLEPYWDYKPLHTYTNEKISKKSTIEEIQLKFDVIHGSVVNALDNQYYTVSF